MTAAPITEELDRRWAAGRARIAVREGAVTLRFGEVLAWSQAISRALAPAVREAGQRVALVMPNSAGFVVAFFGAARIGSVVAPINPRAPVPELATGLADLDPVAVVTTPSLLGEVCAALASVQPPPAVAVVSPPDDVRIVRSPERRARALPSHGSPPLLQQSTSGSTGRPKRVVRTHAALRAELAALRGALRVGEEDRFLGLAPFSHVNGLVRTMLTSMWVGAELHPLDEFHRRVVLETLAREKITVLGAVPQVFVLLARTPVRAPLDLGALRVAFSASAPLLPDDSRAFRDRYGIVIRQLYGSTETGSISYNDDEDPASCFESVGRALDGVELKVIDESGQPVKPHQEGEILVGSPFAAREYLDDPASSAEAFRHGAYRTGDLGRFDARRRLVLTGRRKLVINRGGYKVNPFEVEAVLRGHAKVDDAVVFGVPGRHGDEAVACVIVPVSSCTAEEILEHCRSRLAEFKIPSRIEFRDALPRSASGKVLRERIASP
jgi:long-chain acyl-CoA synthetase